MNFQSEDAEIIVKAIMSYLTGKKRLDLLPKIIEGLGQFQNKESNALEVVTCNQLQEVEKEEIKKAINAKLGEFSEFKFTTDKSILGGVLIKFKDKMIDLSLLGKLNEIEKNID